MLIAKVVIYVEKYQISQYEKRYYELKNKIKKSNLTKNDYYNRLLISAELCLKNLNRNFLAPQTEVLSQRQLDLVLKTLETIVK